VYIVLKVLLVFQEPLLLQAVQALQNLDLVLELEELNL
jgi:hypothetical protein